jgi:AcrR family transcriptional regulator
LTRRERARAATLREIKETARRVLVQEGAGGLALRAVAREMGMVSSAIYRYYASRDELLTALILDAYNSLGEAAEQADASARYSDYRARWLAVARAVRAWAVARPHEYALIYGSPVPGYVAPQDTVLPSIRPVVVLGGILDEAYMAGRLAKDLPRPHRTLRPELAVIAKGVAPSVDEAVMARALIAWTELFGALSFELFGRFKNTITDLATWYEHQAAEMATYIGLPR